MFAGLIFSCILKLSWQKGYFRTEDLPLNNWNTLVVKSFPNIGSKITCAAMCEALNQEAGTECNSFKLKNSICEIGKIKYLKEFEENDPPREPFYVVDKVPAIYKHCRGGDNCCSTENQCQRDKGDCDEDEHCYGHGLICGEKNCGKTDSGLWDSNDDCCTKRCSSDHPCSPGDGICDSDQDCQDPEFNKCELTESCLSLKYFPLADFPNNTNLNYYNQTYYNCCRRRCYGNEIPCDLGMKGCKYDSDCLPGLECKNKICQDINECADQKAIISCGNHTKCNNELKGFSCECQPGFENFVNGTGCFDIDECKLNVCVPNSGCTNKVGGYACQCNAGFQGYFNNILIMY